MHDVQIDETQVSAAFEAEAGQPEAVAPEVPEETQEDTEGGGWEGATEFIASFLAHKVTPAWEVPLEVQQQWAHALAGCLDSVMPGGMAGADSWGPWGQLLFASGAWAMCGFDMQRFGFKPIAEVPEDKDQEAGADNSEGEHNQGAQLHNTGGGTFTTMG